MYAARHRLRSRLAVAARAVARRAVALCAVALLVGAPPVAAEDWPARPVRIVNTFAAGGSADVLARAIAEHLSGVFGQQFFVETRAGAGGVIGVQSVLNTPPDGYNFVITNVSLLVLGPAMNPAVGYDPQRDLTNIAYLAGAPIVMSVNPAAGVKTLPEFIATAKSGSRAMTYSSSGLGSMGHLIAERLAQQAGIRVEHVPYKGAAQGLMDLVGGHIAFAVQTLSSTAAQLRSGGLIGLAHTAAERLPAYPQMPTFAELGFPDLVSTTWFSLSGPAGLPAPVVERVNREAVRALARPEWRERLEQDGMVAKPMDSVAFQAFVAAETARWKPLAERIGSPR